MCKRKRKRQRGGRIRQYRPRRYGGSLFGPENSFNRKLQVQQQVRSFLARQLGGNTFRSPPFFGSWPGNSDPFLRQIGGNSLRRRLRGQ